MKRRIVPGGILALGLAVALLGATASTASAERYIGTWNCPSPSWPVNAPQIKRCSSLFEVDALGKSFDFVGTLGSFDFGYHPGTSTSQRFVLGVSGDTFNPRIGVSGEYAQTNNCPPTLSAGAYPQIDGCLIRVSFTPAGELEGPRPGTLTSGPGGPTLALTGNAEPRDSVPPDLKLSGPKKQSPLDKEAAEDPHGFGQGEICDGGECAVQVKVSCGDEWCNPRATGRLTNVKRDKLSPSGPLPYGIAPGKTAGVGPGLTLKTRKQLRKALAEGKNVKAKVTVDATDSSGNVATAKRTIRLVK